MQTSISVNTCVLITQVLNGGKGNYMYIKTLELCISFVFITNFIVADCFSETFCQPNAFDLKYLLVVALGI